MDKRFNTVLIAGLLSGNEELAAQAVRLLQGTRKEEWQRFCDADLLQGLLDGSGGDLAALVDVAAGYSLPKEWRGSGRGMRALPAILSRLAIDPDASPPPGQFHRVAEYSPAHCFPVAKESGSDDACRRQMWAVKDRLGELDGRGDFTTFYTRLLDLLHRYTWCLPASHRAGVDVPLHEDLRMTSAICACLYRYHQEAGWERLRDDTSEKFLLVTADCAGAQDYVFGLAEEAAGRLRARSFYVDSLGRAVAFKILDEAGLPPVNLLFWAKGRFWLLLPCTAQCAAILARVRRETEEYLLAEFAGAVSLASAQTRLSGRDLQVFDAAACRADAALATAKLSLLRDQLVREGKWRTESFLRPRTITAACPVCRHGDAGPGGLCPQCARDGALGARLAGSEWLVYRKEAVAGSCELLPGLHLEAVARPPADGAGVLLAERINGDEAGDWGGPVSFRPLANHVPLAPGEPRPMLTFPAIAGRARGKKRLAYLKAGVDDMDSIYAGGLPGGGLPVTVTRLAALCTMFDVFFNGWLEKLLTGEFPECYTIFAGGDDLFVAGPWNRVLDLAARLAHDFGRFTGDNGQITLSAGILSTRPDLPAASAYRQVEELLVYAKKGGDNPGNQLAVFGRLIKWSQLPGALESGKRLAGWLDDGVAQAPFVRHLAAYGTMYRRYSEENNVRGLRFLPLLCSEIARNLPPPDSQGKRGAYRRWAESLVHGGSPSHAGLGTLWFVAAYALVASRRQAGLGPVE